MMISSIVSSVTSSTLRGEIINVIRWVASRESVWHMLSGAIETVNGMAMDTKKSFEEPFEVGGTDSVWFDSQSILLNFDSQKLTDSPDSVRPRFCPIPTSHPLCHQCHACNNHSFGPNPNHVYAAAEEQAVHVFQCNSARQMRSRMERIFRLPNCIFLRHLRGH